MHGKLQPFRFLRGVSLRSKMARFLEEWREMEGNGGEMEGDGDMPK